MSRTTGTCTTAPVGGVVAPLPTVRNRAMRRTTDPDVAATSRRYVPAAAPESLRVRFPLSVRERTPAVLSAGFPGRNSAVTPAGRTATVTVATESASAVPFWYSTRFTTTLPPARTTVGGVTAPVTPYCVRPAA